MKRYFFQLILILSSWHYASAQTSWTGSTSTDWNSAANWTVGVPAATVDAIIGDASFTGAFQPIVNATSACKSLTIGTAAKVSSLTIARNLTVSGAVTIGSNGTLLANSANRTLTLSGNWTNTGIYSATVASAQVTFSGSTQSLTGSTTFQRLHINSGSTLTLANNIVVNNALSVSGTLDPTASFSVSGTGTFTVNSGGIIHVKAATYSANYTLSGSTTLNGRSTVNYSSASINQTVSDVLTYGYLRISGGLVKSLTGNLPPLNSSTANAGRIYIDAGTFDLLTYTADRGSSVNGGFFIMSAGSVLRIGGTNGFPANFNTLTLASTSTVEYYGNNQAVRAATYGHLLFSSTSGAVVKTMPATAITVAGNFTCTVGSGTGVTFTAGNTITVNRDVVMDASATFNASSFSHVFRGSWTNNGVFSGGTSTATFSGVSAILSGTGTNNFNNLIFSAAGITASGATAINVSGNISTSGSGIFIHGSGGTLTMSGTTKTISGNGFTFANLSLTGSISTAANIKISGDLIVNGTFSASAGTIIFNGASKTISGGGAITFFSINVLGTISTASDFTMLADISVSIAGSFSASAGTATFNGTGCDLAGTANLYNVTINGGQTLRLGTNSILGIANTFTKTGTLNVTTNVPSTVEYNSAGAQSIVNTTYNNLVLANGGTKTAAGAITVNRDFTINNGVTFDGSTFIFSLYRHWTNNGTFTSSTSDVQLRGANAATITGATTFYNLTENKSSTVLWTTLASNIIVANNLTMTQGNMQTGTYTVTVNGSRPGTGTGLIIGTITQNHAFTNGTTYYFEGPHNRIVFTSPSAGLTSVTVKTTIGEISDFDPSIECVLREYEIIIPAGTYTNATLRLHYQDNELNAFDEPNLTQFKFNSGTTWDNMSFTTRDVTANYVEKTALATVSGRWTLSGTRKVVRWDGSASSDWGDLNNWTTISGTDMSNRVPTSTDAAEIGQAAFTNNPAIASAYTVNVMRYGDVQASALTISSGSLTTIGSIKGLWVAAATHTLDVSSGALIAGTNFNLSDGTGGHDILLKIGSGSATINYDLTQDGTGEVNFTGNGSLSIGGAYNYSAGNFTAGPGTVIYTGGEAQIVAPLTYNNLSFTKSTERATINSSTTINGDLTTATGGELEVSGTLSVLGNITIGAGTDLIETGVMINVGGNWTNNGAFTVSNGTVNFNGSGSQTVNSNIFNSVTINKSSGTLSLTGNVTLNSDLSLSSGTLDLSSYSADRSNPGGTLTLGAATLLKIAGAVNFPNYFNSATIDQTSTVEYYGTVAQNISDVDYGNLTTSNGGASAKTLSGDISVNGNLLINNNSTIAPDINSITLFGNLVLDGTFIPGTSTLILQGSSKTLSGTSTLSLNNLYVTGGTYTVSSSVVSLSGDLFIDVAPSLCNFGAATITSDGDFTNKGSVTSAGILTFTGTRVQTISLIGAIISASTGVVNFNGTFPFASNSTSAPSFATVNINNTGGTIAPLQPWTVAVACNIAAGVTVDFGPHNHTFFKDFTNNGTVLSSGKLKFMPGAPYSASGTVTLDAGAGTLTSSGEVEFAGTGTLTVAAINVGFTNVSITNTNAVGITPANDWTIGQDLYIAPGSIFNAGTATSHTIDGNVTNNGTLNGNSSTITFTGNPAFIDGVGSGNYFNVSAATGSNLTLNKSINVLGDLVIDGNFVALGRTVSFTGSGASTISGSAGLVTFGDLEVNKTGAATTLSVPAIVVNELKMTNGLISTTATNLLTLNDDATSTPGTSSSYVDGPMKKIGDDAFVFPVGKAGYWARIGISAPGLAADAFLAEYYAASYSVTSVVAPLDHVSLGEYWILDRNAGTSNVTATLFWESGTRSGINDLTDLVVARYNGTNWTDETQNGGTTGIAAAGSVTSQSISSFSPFTFGSKTAGGGINPLPVELLDFSALPDSSIVNIFWNTASESNSDIFIVERSSNAIDFNETVWVKAAGNSSAIKNYFAVDIDPLPGISYYRLQQKDMNGQSSYSSIVKVVFKNQESENVIIYPNPATDKFEMRFPTPTKGKILVVVSDIFGNEYYSTVESLESSENVILISPDKKLPVGIYTVVASSDDAIYRKKIVIR